MFTGLIEATGRVLGRTTGEGAARLTIGAPASLVERLRTGDSVSVSGVCLTALALAEDRFSADLAAETLSRTTLGALQPGAVVNLERPTPAGAPLGGHVVQGHVDGTARLLALDAITPTNPDATDWRLRLELPPSLARFVVAQGSIAVEGISLTVAAAVGETVEIAIIPHTYRATSLHTLRPGTLLNIETDVLARYAARRPAAFQVTESYLLANGF